MKQKTNQEPLAQRFSPQVRIRHLETCTTCSGSGVKPGAKSSTCGQCGGSGVVIQATRTPLGAFQTQTTCPTCRGTGVVVEEYCGTCSGQGLVEKTKQVKVRATRRERAGEREASGRLSM